MTAKTKTAKTATVQPDVYERVTAAIVAALEQGTRPWMQPWDAARAAGPVSRPSRHDGTPYRGVNVLLLWRAAAENGYAAPCWMTYRQAQELGGQVRQGERGALVVYANTIKKTETDERTGEEAEVEIPFLKGYTVFNAEQIDGLPARFHATATAPVQSDAERSARLDAFFTATGADVRYGGHRAFYAIDEDRIQMPPFETFHSPDAFYGTLAHECVHWAGHSSRLNRDLGHKQWGDAGYAMEELVAEIGSAFVCAELGLIPDIRADHAPYIASWLKVLADDKRAIFVAAGHAQKAADFLLARADARAAEEPERQAA
jgi:antirestriction protein ArdC